jgi:hypothetical protein
MLFPPSPLLQPPRGQVVTIVGYTAKTQYRKFETNIPRKGIARPQSQFQQSVSDLYIPTIGLPRREIITVRGQSYVCLSSSKILTPHPPLRPASVHPLPLLGGGGGGGREDTLAYSAAGKYVDQSWEYINRLQTHKCGNWDWGRAILFLGIHKWDFRCSVSELKNTATWRKKSVEQIVGGEKSHIWWYTHI